MLFNTFVPFISLLVFLTSTSASPITRRNGTSSASSPSQSQSLNNYGNLSSMANFDNFYGSGNFDGSKSSTTIVIKETQTEVVCHTEQITIVQQKLAILREMTKRIITEQICDVETQTIILEQHLSSSSSFQKDLSRQSNSGPSKPVGYDANIASLLANTTNSNGSLSTNDLGFNGSAIGQNYVSPSGSNWNDTSSPSSVSNALSAAQSALNATLSG